MIISILYAGSFSFLLIYIFFMLKYIRLWKSTPDFSFSEGHVNLKLTVVIPFFNEEKSLHRIITSLKKQTLNQKYWEVLFVNDNSTDNSAAVLKEYCLQNANCSILNNRGEGKKSALKTGIENAKGELIVTTDADCVFPENRLKTILNFYSASHTDFMIMPVVMTGNRNFLQRFFVTDFLALQMVTAGSALSGKPLMSNGANMAFKRIADDPDLKENYASGEDMFLLEWMKKEGKKTGYLKSKDVLVSTRAPQTLKQFLSQRSRWISKAGGYRDAFLIAFSLLVFSVNLLTVIFLIASFLNPDMWFTFGLWYGSKTLTDYLLIRSGFSFFEIHISLPEFAFMQLLYPFYMLLVTVGGFLFPVKWK